MIPTCHKSHRIPHKPPAFLFHGTNLIRLVTNHKLNQAKPSIAQARPNKIPNWDPTFKLLSLTPSELGNKLSTKSSSTHNFYQRLQFLTPFDYQKS